MNSTNLFHTQLMVDHSLFLRMLFYSFFKSLVGKDVIVELKNDLSICGTLHSVDQFLNIKLTGKHCPVSRYLTLSWQISWSCIRIVECRRRWGRSTAAKVHHIEVVRRLTPIFLHAKLHARFVILSDAVHSNTEWAMQTLSSITEDGRAQFNSILQCAVLVLGGLPLYCRCAEHCKTTAAQ